MLRGVLRFTLRIAFRCVLHRCESQDIRWYELLGLLECAHSQGVSVFKDSVWLDFGFGGCVYKYMVFSVHVQKTHTLQSTTL